MYISIVDMHERYDAIVSFTSRLRKEEYKKKTQGIDSIFPISWDIHKDESLMKRLNSSKENYNPKDQRTFILRFLLETFKEWFENVDNKFVVQRKTFLHHEYQSYIKEVSNFKIQCADVKFF